MPCAPNGSVVTGPTGQATDDAGLLVIEQRQHLGVVLGHQERPPPELGAPVFEAVDQLGHRDRDESTVAAATAKVPSVL